MRSSFACIATLVLDLSYGSLVQLKVQSRNRFMKHYETGSKYMVLDLERGNMHKMLRVS
jgi:hypothetical protein